MITKKATDVGAMLLHSTAQGYRGFAHVLYTVLHYVCNCTMAVKLEDLQKKLTCQCYFAHSASVNMGCRGCSLHPLSVRDIFLQHKRHGSNSRTSCAVRSPEQRMFLWNFLPLFAAMYTMVYFCSSLSSSLSWSHSHWLSSSFIDLSSAGNDAASCPFLCLVLSSMMAAPTTITVPHSCAQNKFIILWSFSIRSWLRLTQVS